MLLNYFICLIVLLNAGIFCDVRKKKADLIKKLLKRHRIDGAIRLIDGKDRNEGNVQIFHKGKWRNICDDEWDIRDAEVVCRQLKYPAALKAVHNSLYNKALDYWMDNVYCDGTEARLNQCRFDGWGVSDCTEEEAAGVICLVNPKNEDYLKDGVLEKNQPPQDAKIKPNEKNLIKKIIKSSYKLRLKGGRIYEEGRIEFKHKDSKWMIICGEGWSLLEANVVCKELNLGFALTATQVHFHNDVTHEHGLSGVECRGNESTLTDCKADIKTSCNGQEIVAGVMCSKVMPDLQIDSNAIIKSAYLEDRQLYFLQCAMEENCLASSAYRRQIEVPESWHLEIRRLLRFTAKVTNIGNASFRPALPKHLWQFHQCHMHYHSMEVFATFDILSMDGKVVAEGHKASFCLEDNDCLPKSEGPKFACANYGDQGISVNCSDIYKHNIDCQWVDVTDLEVGHYIFKVSINPEFKVAEQSFENNAAVCEMIYTETFAKIYNCKITKP